MATSTTKNVYQKLLTARATFLKSEVTKSGKNMQLAFKYFELDDIVPIATRIFEEIGLISIVSFSEDVARMSIVNIDTPEEMVVFTAPFKALEPIISNTGKKATNEMMALGASITYMRRYLYMIALDICEPDEIDSGMLGTTPVATSTPTATTVVNNVQTAAPTEKPLTNAGGNASEIQIKQLKEVLKNLLAADSSYEKTVEEIAIKTKGFTVISKADCETITLWAGAALKEVK